VLRLQREHEDGEEVARVLDAGWPVGVVHVLKVAVHAHDDEVDGGEEQPRREEADAEAGDAPAPLHLDHRGEDVAENAATAGAACSGPQTPT